MAQQSEGDDKSDDAATEEVAAHGAHERRHDPPIEGQADPDSARDTDPMRAPLSSLHPKDPAPKEMQTNLARLKSAFPAFSFTICRGWGGPRFEAWRDTTLSGLYAIITDDPDELQRELNMAVR